MVFKYLISTVLLYCCNKLSQIQQQKIAQICYCVARNPEIQRPLC